MKKFGRMFIFMLSLLIAGTACACAAPDDNGGGKDTFPYYSPKENRKTDGQFYAPDGIVFPASLWTAPAAVRCAELDRGSVRAYYIDSVGGTKVFCYVGLPEGASSDAKVPAAVLVHGATGTAFYDWVRAWNEKGYAAIAMDTEGRTPTLNTSTNYPDYADYGKSIAPGPLNVSFTDSGKPVAQQWVYNAVAAVVAATSYISSLPEVDPSRVGITGVSYGAFLTCLLVGFDDRFAFAAPVYGCLANLEGETDFGSYMRSTAGAERWDGLGPLEKSRTPILFVNSNIDDYFSVKSTTLCAKASRYGAMTILNGFTHGHSQGAEVSEVFAFADEICRGGTPLVRITSQPDSNGEVGVAIPKGVTLTKSKFWHTDALSLKGDTVWESENNDMEGSLIFYPYDSSVPHYYIEITDSRGYRISTEVL